MLIQKEDLIKHLQQLNIYDLERLQKCFEYEYKIRPNKREEIQDILDHIKYMLEQQ